MKKGPKMKENKKKKSKWKDKRFWNEQWIDVKMREKYAKNMKKPKKLDTRRKNVGNEGKILR